MPSEETNYPSLTLGHPSTSCTVLHIVGLKLLIYGLEEIRSSKLPIAALIATHGRCNYKEQMGFFAQGILGEVNAKAEGEERKRDLIVVVLVSGCGALYFWMVVAEEAGPTESWGTNSRQEGEPGVRPEPEASVRPQLLWEPQDTRCGLSNAEKAQGPIWLHALDVSFIIGFLAAYLFPNGERIIEEYIATGVSLGGNVTWRLLLTEPRLRVAIPIIGLPFTSFGTYLRARALSMGLKWEPPLYPPSLKSLIEITAPPGAYAGKKILSIHGETDELVPLRQGKADIDAAMKEANGGEVEGGQSSGVVWVQHGQGHVVTLETVRRTADWVWRWALSAGAGGAATKSSSHM